MSKKAPKKDPRDAAFDAERSAISRAGAQIVADWIKREYGVHHVKDITGREWEAVRDYLDGCLKKWLA